MLAKLTSLAFLHKIKSHSLLLHFHFLYASSQTVSPAASLAIIGLPSIISPLHRQNSFTHMAFTIFYGFSLTPMYMNHRLLHSLNSNVCGQYSILYLYHRSRVKTLAQLFSAFSSQDRAWNDNPVARFVSKRFPHHHQQIYNSHSFQSCLYRLLCKK